MKAVGLKSDHLVQPIGMNPHAPVLSWCCEGGAAQSAYHVTASVNGSCVWDSGEVASCAMQVRCGYTAGARERVSWSVRLCDENGAWGSESTAFFECGLTKELWTADWINPETEEKAGEATLRTTEQPARKKRKKKAGERQPASVLRKIFCLKPDQAAEPARLYITCHGLYAAWLNGQRVGDFVLAPGVDDYKKRLQVQCYDITGMLKDGENELRVVLGDGWYRGNNGIDGSHNLSGTDLALLCQLECAGKPVVWSETSWQASQSGPVRQNDMELGETYDAGREEITDWHGVKKAQFGFENLTGTETVPIREQETFPGKLLQTPNGETVIDFGQNLAGYTQLRVRAKAGQRICLYHGETLDENGNFTQANYEPGARNKNGGIPQKLEYIAKDGWNIWKPLFCIFGFRYAKVETDMDLKEAQFTAIAVYSEMEQTGFFHCGNPDVDRLFHNSLWSMRSNFCDIPTDCPTRERAGWTGDAAAFAPTAVYLADCYPVLRKWLSACRDAQKKNGVVSNIAPANNVTGIIGKIIRGSAGWGDACILVPWALYQAYKDPAILAENYDMMVKWLAFCTKRASSTRRKNRKNPYHNYLVDKGFHFGEWLEPDISSMDAMRKNMKEGAPEVATAYFYRSAELLAEIATILGKKEDAENFGNIAANARKAYRFSCTDQGKITSLRQCEYVRPIAFGLLEPQEAKEAADALEQLVEKNGYHLNTGFLSTPYLCSVLSDYGHVQTAYRLLLQDTCPGWLYAVKKGATSIWETWDGIRLDGTVHDSLNHYAYGAISGWLFGGVAGIRLTDGQFTICPKPDPVLQYASAKWKSPLGTVKSAWEYKEDGIDFTITIPPNTKAAVLLPDGREETVGAGSYCYHVASAG